MNVLLESAHVVVAVVYASSSSASQALMLVTLLLDVVLCLLHSNYDFLKLLFLFVFFSLKFLRLNIVTHYVVRERQLFYLEIHNCPTYLDCFRLGNTQWK